ncbi:MAG: DUF4124 domain-containing protein [Methylophilaceae bacterium]|nr:DUF4124 domain-containing protein [Methylophilaceae bacterium]
MQRLSTWLLVGLTVGATGQPVHAEVFKWRDASGRVHYADRPPMEQPSKDVSSEIAPPPCDEPCQKNSAQYQKYIQDYMAKKKAEEARFLTDRNASVEKTRQEQAQRQQQVRQAAEAGRQKSEQERHRIPSHNTRRY